MNGMIIRPMLCERGQNLIQSNPGHFVLLAENFIIHVSSAKLLNLDL